MEVANSVFRMLNLHDDNAKVAVCVSAALSSVLGVIIFIMLLQACMRIRFRSYRDGFLGREAINKCPVFVYSTVKENMAVECVVCLSEFEECDVIKMLPKCQHVFHQHCIDAWLSSRMDCPICREKVAFDAPREEQEVQGTESEVAVTAAEQPEVETVVGPAEDSSMDHGSFS